MLGIPFLLAGFTATIAVICESGKPPGAKGRSRPPRLGKRRDTTFRPGEGLEGYGRLQELEGRVVMSAPTPVGFPVSTAAQFVDVIENHAHDGDTVILNAPIQIPDELAVDVAVTIKGNGNALTSADPNNPVLKLNADVGLEDVVFQHAGGFNPNSVAVEVGSGANVPFTNVSFQGQFFQSLVIDAGGMATLTNCSVTNATEGIFNNGTVTINGGTFNAGTTGGVALVNNDPGVATIFNAATFNSFTDGRAIENTGVLSVGGNGTSAAPIFNANKTAIHSYGPNAVLTVTDVTFSDNTVYTTDNFVASAIEAGGVVSLSGNTFTGNEGIVVQLYDNKGGAIALSSNDFENNPSKIVVQVGLAPTNRGTGAEPVTLNHNVFTDNSGQALVVFTGKVTGQWNVFNGNGSSTAGPTVAYTPAAAQSSSFELDNSQWVNNHVASDSSVIYVNLTGTTSATFKEDAIVSNTGDGLKVIATGQNATVTAATIAFNSGLGLDNEGANFGLNSSAIGGNQGGDAMGTFVSDTHNLIATQGAVGLNPNEFQDPQFAGETPAPANSPFAVEVQLKPTSQGAGTANSNLIGQVSGDNNVRMAATSTQGSNNDVGAFTRTLGKPSSSGTGSGGGSSGSGGSTGSGGSSGSGGTGGTGGQGGQGGTGGTGGSGSGGTGGTGSSGSGGSTGSSGSGGSTGSSGSGGSTGGSGSGGTGSTGGQGGQGGTGGTGGTGGSGSGGSSGSGGGSTTTSHTFTVTVSTGNGDGSLPNILTLISGTGNTINFAVPFVVLPSNESTSIPVTLTGGNVTIMGGHSLTFTGGVELDNITFNNMTLVLSGSSVIINGDIFTGVQSGSAPVVQVNMTSGQSTTLIVSNSTWQNNGAGVTNLLVTPGTAGNAGDVNATFNNLTFTANQGPAIVITSAGTLNGTNINFYLNTSTSPEYLVSLMSPSLTSTLSYVDAVNNNLGGTNSTVLVTAGPLTLNESLVGYNNANAILVQPGATATTNTTTVWKNAGGIKDSGALILNSTTVGSVVGSINGTDGHTLVKDVSKVTGSGLSSTDKKNVDPKLGPETSPSGTTFAVVVLLPEQGSPLIGGASSVNIGQKGLNGPTRNDINNNIGSGVGTYQGSNGQGGNGGSSGGGSTGQGGQGGNGGSGGSGASGSGGSNSNSGPGSGTTGNHSGNGDGNTTTVGSGNGTVVVINGDGNTVTVNNGGNSNPGTASGGTTPPPSSSFTLVVGPNTYVENVMYAWRTRVNGRWVSRPIGAIHEGYPRGVAGIGLTQHSETWVTPKALAIVTPQYPKGIILPANTTLKVVYYNTNVDAVLSAEGLRRVA